MQDRPAAEQPPSRPARPATIAGAAIYRKVPERTMRRWVERGLIRAWRHGPRRIIVDLDDVDTLFRSVTRDAR